MIFVKINSRKDAKTQSKLNQYFKTCQSLQLWQVIVCSVLISNRSRFS